MTKFAKQILLASIPVILVISIGLLYMWRNQAVQLEVNSAGFKRLEVLLISNREVSDLKFDLLKKDINNVNSSVKDNIKRISLSIETHEEEDRRLMELVFKELKY